MSGNNIKKSKESEEDSPPIRDERIYVRLFPEDRKEWGAFVKKERFPSISEMVRHAVNKFMKNDIEYAPAIQDDSIYKNVITQLIQFFDYAFNSARINDLTKKILAEIAKDVIDDKLIDKVKEDLKI